MKIQMTNDILNKLTETKTKEEDRPWTNHWTYITVEGYCFLDSDYNKKKDKFCYEIPDKGTFDDMKKVPNPDYDPNVSRPPVPEFCKRKVCYTCLEKDCEFFSFGEPQEDPCERKRKFRAAQKRKKSKKENVLDRIE